MILREIEADNTIKRYARRHKVLEDYCLADFVSTVVSVSNKGSKNDKEDDDDCSCHDSSDTDIEEGVSSAYKHAANISRLRYSTKNHKIRKLQ